ncbi:hypothetical protein GCM10009689_17650 [Brevibacterium antiquum]|uniref:hypothetical protein n=1 Tax=Brevibacterium antiquum TaxID=234835 RepID=UPI0018DF36A4|nr:hypothetical protein [Brevibacterium antiquum]
MNLMKSLIVIGVPAAIIALIVAAFLVFSGPKDDGEGNSPAPTHISEGDIEEETTPATEETHDPAKAEEDEVQEVAKDFTRAYVSMSYEDDSPNPWVDAIKEFSTPKFYDSRTNDVDVDDGGTMVSEMERRHMSEFPEFDDTYVQKDDAKTYRVYVQYQVVNESDGGRFLTGEFSVVTVVKTGGKWLVSDEGTSEDAQKGFFDQGHDH